MKKLQIKKSNFFENCITRNHLLLQFFTHIILPISLVFIMTLLANVVCINAFGNIEIIYNV